MRVANGAVRRRGLGSAALVGAVLAALLGVAPAGAVQDETPGIPPPAAEATAAAPAEAAPPSAEVDAAAPHVQTAAQGSVGVEGAVVWRVRQVEVSAEGTAASTAGAAFYLQRAGASLLEEEASGRRVRLDPGEAAFVGAEDGATLTPAGAEPAGAWVLELVAPNASAGEGLGAGTVLFTSDVVEDYPAGTIEVELRRGVLLGNERAEVTAETGPALLMVTSGRVQLTPEEGEAETIDAGLARLESGSVALRNPDAQPAAFVVAALGETLEEAAAPADEDDAADEPAADAGTPAATQGEAQQETSGEGTESDDAAADEEAAGDGSGQESAAEDAATTAGDAVAATGTDTDGDGLSDEDEAVYGSDPLNADYDADGLADGAEVNQYFSDPLNNDSDGDGLIDGDEVNQYGSNPASTDGDGDGLTDQQELFEYGTGPGSPDTDGDGTWDGEEVLNYGTDPTSADSAP